MKTDQDADLETMVLKLLTGASWQAPIARLGLQPAVTRYDNELTPPGLSQIENNQLFRLYVDR